MNRIEQAITKLSARIAGLDAEKIARLESAATADCTELAVYQNAKSLAQAEGRINYEEAMTIYQVLRNFAHEPLSARIVVMQTIAELSAARVA